MLQGRLFAGNLFAGNLFGRVADTTDSAQAFSGGWWRYTPVTHRRIKREEVPAKKKKKAKSKKKIVDDCAEIARLGFEVRTEFEPVQKFLFNNLQSKPARALSDYLTERAIYFAILKRKERDRLIIAAHDAAEKRKKYNEDAASILLLGARRQAKKDLHKQVGVVGRDFMSAAIVLLDI